MCVITFIIVFNRIHGSYFSAFCVYYLPQRLLLVVEVPLRCYVTPVDLLQFVPLVLIKWLLCHLSKAVENAQGPYRTPRIKSSVTNQMSDQLLIQSSWGLGCLVCWQVFCLPFLLHRVGIRLKCNTICENTL